MLSPIPCASSTRACSPRQQNLVQALADIAAALPDLLEDIQGQLLDLLSLILSGKPFSPLTRGKAVQGLVHSLSMSELSAPEQTKLALNTIGTMDFGRVSWRDVGAVCSQR